MLISRQREKLCQAIVFFAGQTNKLGKTKLFKLLFFLDFEHFKRTGRSVTGLRYFAWPKGPVPRDLFDEFDQLAEDLAAHVRVEQITTMRGTMRKVAAMSKFDPRFFSKREIALMERLASEYRNASADEMVEATHLENRPWHQVYNEQKKPQSEIPYQLALNRQEADDMLRHIRERQEVLQNYNNNTKDGSRNDPI